MTKGKALPLLGFLLLAVALFATQHWFRAAVLLRDDSEYVAFVLNIVVTALAFYFASRPIWWTPGEDSDSDLWVPAGILSGLAAIVLCGCGMYYYLNGKADIGSNVSVSVVNAILGLILASALVLWIVDWVVGKNKPPGTGTD